ncbi:MAG: NAD(P)H-dependent oxidoreductase [Bacillota bacterium]
MCRLRPCQACGHCGRITGRCAISVDDLAEITARLARADGIIIVSPHYAPIPAKLSALLERLEPFLRQLLRARLPRSSDRHPLRNHRPSGWPGSRLLQSHGPGHH